MGGALATGLPRPVIRPARPSPPDRYSRIFAEAAGGRPSKSYIEKLGHLAWSMQGDESLIPTDLQPKNPPAAGYTYFGQFIDHDLTEDRTPMRSAGKFAPSETINYRGPWLNLSGIYDRIHDRGKWKYLYKSDGVSFQLGDPTVNGEQFDVALDKNHHPLLPDRRNNENVIIRQIHAMFLKLHNLAIEEFRVDNPSYGDTELFAAARQRVCWQYQYLVREDFLKKVCCEKVFDELVNKNAPPIIDWKTDGFSMPVEISQAVLRFGHSMVRPKYTLSVTSGRVDLQSILCGGEARALREAEAIHWPTFLIKGGELAMRIDTSISSALFELHNKDIHPFVSSPKPHPPHPLPVRTLVRGAKSRLPTGQRIATRMGIPTFKIPAADGPYDPGAALRRYDLAAETPLWYYVLLEAGIQELGACLGTLGSQLLIETVNAALTEDPDSYLNQPGSDSGPPIWKKTNKTANNLYEVAQLVNLTP
jgi:hypothetical protein